MESCVREGFICPECKTYFESAQLLTSHYRALHETNDVEPVPPPRFRPRISNPILDGKRETQPSLPVPSPLRSISDKLAGLNASQPALLSFLLKVPTSPSIKLKSIFTGLTGTHVKITDSSGAHVKTTDSLGALVETTESSEAHVRTTNSSETHVKTTDSSENHVTTTDSSRALVKTTDNSEAHVKAKDCSGAHEKNTDSSGAHGKTQDSLGAHVNIEDNAGAHVKTKNNSGAHVKTTDSLNKKKRLAVSDADLKSKSLVDLFTGEEKKVKLTTRSHTDYWYKIRTEKLQNEGKQTDRVLRNLEKYLDGTVKNSASVTFLNLVETKDEPCSRCEKQFLLTRRRRHCKLCHAAICDNCSMHLDIRVAESLVRRNPSHLTSTGTQVPVRHCHGCHQLIAFIQGRNKPDEPHNDFCATYSEMQNLKRQLTHKILSYKDLLEYLLIRKVNAEDATVSGDLRADLVKGGKEILSLGKRIAACPTPNGNRHARIQLNILIAAKDFSEELLWLPRLPSPVAVGPEPLPKPSSEYELTPTWEDSWEWVF